MKDSPAELTMVLDPGYELRIPNDSVVELRTAGVLGETFAEIDIAGTSGPPAAPNAVLRSRPVDQITMSQMIQRLSAALGECSKRDLKRDDSAVSGNAPGTRSAPKTISH
jgi:ABC-type transporter Mla subunit MlaD